MDNTLNIFQHARVYQEYAAGEIIFQEGDASDFMFVVVQGEVDVYREGEHIERLNEGTILGEMGLLEGQPRSATAVAATHVRLAPINERQFAFMVSETPGFALAIMRALSQRLRKITA